jgi:hypothetical protein
MNSNQSTSDGRIKRRNFLRASGTLAGASAFGVGTVSADRDVSNRLRLVEIGFEHELEPFDEDGGRPAELHIDERQEYSIDRDSKTLHVLGSSTDATAEALTEADMVVRTPDNAVEASERGNPFTVASQSTGVITTSLSQNLQPMEGVRVEQEYVRPSVSVGLGSDVSVPGRGAVSPGQTAQVDFERTEAQVRTYVSGEEPARRTVTLQTRPRLQIQTGGQLDVVDHR